MNMPEWLVGGLNTAFTILIVWTCFFLVAWVGEQLTGYPFNERWRVWITIAAVGVGLEIGRRMHWRKGP